MYRDASVPENIDGAGKHLSHLHEAAMTAIPTDRYEAALRALIEVQLKPMNYSQHRVLAWTALDALAPDLALLPPNEAWERVQNERNS